MSDNIFVGGELLRFNKKQVYVAFDYETDGLNLFYCKPWQLSWIKFTLDEVIEEGNLYIHHENLNISTQIAAMTHFDQQDYLSKSIPPKQVMEIFNKDFLNPDIKLIAHNFFGYDSMVYQIAQRLAGNKVDYSFLTRSIDTLALARAWKMGIKLDNSSPESLLSSQYKIVRHYDRKIKCSLGQLNKDFELGFNENDLHNASVDSRLLMEVFKKLLWQVEI